MRSTVMNHLPGDDVIVAIAPSGGDIDGLEERVSSVIS
jgi:hypothetical protein